MKLTSLLDPFFYEPSDFVGVLEHWLLAKESEIDAVFFFRLGDFPADTLEREDYPPFDLTDRTELLRFASFAGLRFLCEFRLAPSMLCRLSAKSLLPDSCLRTRGLVYCLAKVLMTLPWGALC